MKIQTPTVYLFFLLFLYNCNAPEKYIDDAVDTMQKYSIMRDSINWLEFRKEVKEKGKNTIFIKQTYPAIRYALRKLGDHHSGLLTERNQKEMFNENNPLPEIKSKLIYNRIAYISIPGFVGDKKLVYKYAENLQRHLIELDTNKITGWIIDLRKNKGGNMWPMLLGIGPLLGDGTAGYFVNADKKYSKWGYNKGIVFMNEYIILKLENNYILKNAGKKIAVLISKRTASSGEAIAVAFKGLDNTMFFGKNTRGLSTGNRRFELSDGAILVLTSSIFADRNRNVYGLPVEPDTVCKNARKYAVQWISQK